MTWLYLIPGAMCGGHYLARTRMTDFNNPPLEALCVAAFWPIYAASLIWRRK